MFTFSNIWLALDYGLHQSDQSLTDEETHFGGNLSSITTVLSIFHKSITNTFIKIKYQGRSACLRYRVFCVTINLGIWYQPYCIFKVYWYLR